MILFRAVSFFKCNKLIGRSYEKCILKNRHKSNVNRLLHTTHATNIFILKLKPPTRSKQKIAIKDKREMDGKHKK